MSLQVQKFQILIHPVRDGYYFSFSTLLVVTIDGNVYVFRKWVT